MFFLVYKTTHVPTGKFYIGRHVTNVTKDPNDRYMGSGLIIARYLRKYPRSEFNRQILFHAFTLEAMKQVEAILIAEAEKDDCLNIDMFIDGLRVMSPDGRARLSAFRLQYQHSDKVKNKIADTLAKRQVLANGWKIQLADQSVIEVPSLKQWCRENNIKYLSLYRTLKSSKAYNGMKVTRG